MDHKPSFDLAALQADLEAIGERHGVRFLALIETQSSPDAHGFVRVGFHLGGHPGFVSLLGPYVQAAVVAFGKDNGRK